MGLPRRSSGESHPLLHCDVVILGESARLRFPFTALGVTPEAGSSFLLPSWVSWAHAMWSLLSSEWMNAEAAVAMGLALRAVPDADLVAEVQGTADAIAAHDPTSVAATKRLVTVGRADMARAAMAREMQEMSALFGSRS